MVKAIKKMKRAKLKMKKKSSSEVKGRPSNSKKNSGAPEKIKPENELNSDTSETSPEIVYKLVRRVLRVDHIECENKAIRNAQRVLKKAKNSGSTDEIDDAESTLQELQLQIFFILSVSIKPYE